MNSRYIDRFIFSSLAVEGIGKRVYFILNEIHFLNILFNTVQYVL